MKNFKKFILVFLILPAIAFGAASIFNGDAVKILKDTLRFKNGTDIVSPAANQVQMTDGTLSVTNSGGASSEQFGASASASNSKTTAVGNTSIASAANSTAVGANSSVTGGSSVAVGADTQVAGGNSVGVGYFARTAGSNSISIGRLTNVAHNESIGLGTSVVSTGTNQLILGTASTKIYDAYIGEGITDATPPTLVTVQTTGGSGTNINGGNIAIAGGKSTGSGLGGEVRIQTSPAGGSGTSLNALVTAMTVQQDSDVQINERLIVENDILLNKGFEANTFSDHWTLTTVTTAPVGSEETTTVFEGDKSYKIALTTDPYTLNLSQDITELQYANSQVAFSCAIKSSNATIRICSRLAGASTGECSGYYDGSDSWKRLEIILTAPTSGSMGLEIITDGDITDDVFVDDCRFTDNPINFKDGWVYEYINHKALGSTLLDGTNDFRFNLSNVVETGADLITPEDDSANTRTKFNVKYNNTVVDISFSGHSSSSTADAWVYVNGNGYDSGTYAVNANESSSVSMQLELNEGDYFSVGYAGGRSATSGSDQTLNIVAKRKNTQLIENSDIVSSNDITYSFKSSAITDCGGADPIGTYNTYYYAINTNAEIICTAQPDASRLPNNTDGIQLYSRPYNVASSCNASATPPARFDICVGKGLKAHKLAGYTAANRGGVALSPVVHFKDADATMRGLWNNYNEKTGILHLDAGNTTEAGVTTHQFLGSSTNTGATIGYWHFAISKNPVVNAIDAVPRVDYSWENTFSAAVGATGTSGPVTNENVDWIDGDCTETGSVFTCTFVSGHFTQTPNCQATINPVGSQDERIAAINSVSATSIQVNTGNHAGTASDYPFSLTCQRSAGDYRSRGDAAAIIAQPSCYLVDRRDSGQPGGQFTSGAYTARRFDSVVTGDCSFLTIGSTNSDTNMANDNYFTQWTLEKGTYKVEAHAPAYVVGAHKAKLWNDSKSEDAVVGTSAMSSTSDTVQTNSVVLGNFTVTDATDNYELTHYANTTKATNGYGIQTSSGSVVENYTTVKITKIK